MARIRPLWIQLYQERPGDLGIKLIPTPDDDIEAAKQRTCDCLKHRFENQKPKPQYARLVDAAGVAIATYRVNLNQEVEPVSEETNSS